ncbi:hypothetical protein Q5752_006340 [Cryptotrichosporon argae]
MPRIMLAVAALALALPAMATSYDSRTYIGCYSSAPTDISATSYNVLTRTSCENSCTADEWNYAWWSESNGCICTAETDDSSLDVLEDSDDGSESDTYDNPVCSDDDYYVVSLTTSFTFGGCYDAYDDTSVTTNKGSYPPAQCFAQCASSELAFVYATSSGFECYCADVDVDDKFNANDDGVPCDWYTFMAWSHTPDAAASSLARRQLAARAAMARRAQPALCPAGKTACSIADSTHGYECIDTLSELESCGGCTTFELGNSNATAGVDCSALTGVALGATTCALGKCEVYACQRGYTLVDGACV